MKNKNKKLNIYAFFFLMIIAYLFFEVLSKFIPQYISQGILYGKYGRYFIGELAWLILIIFIVYFTNNSEVLSNKKEGFLKTLLIGLPMFIYSIVLTFTNVGELINAKLPDVVSLIIYCSAIGLAEEFMCRGWILNSFLRIYDDKRKNVILSIIFSSLIFGGMHITNIWYGGQTLPETLIQILFATSAGIYFGSLFYRTKNLLAIAFLHGFYDFSLMISDVNLLKDCISNDSTKTLLYSLILNLVISVILIIAGMVVIRKSKTETISNEKEFNEQYEKDDVFKKMAVILSLGLYAVTVVFAPRLMNITSQDFEESSTCFNYPKINLKNVETSYNNFDYYKITDNLSIISENNNLYLKNQNDKTLIVKDIIRFYIVENDDKYQVLYSVSESNSSDSIVYYSDYLIKGDIKEDKDYIDLFIKSFKEYKMPPITKIGKIKDREDNYYYPLIEDYNHNLFMLDKEKQMRHIIIDKTKVSELEIEKINRENKELSQKLLNYVPFIDFKNNEYTDVYRGVNSKLEELDIKVLYSFAFIRSNQVMPEEYQDLSICGEFEQCAGNAYVLEEELNKNLQEMFNKTPEDITNFVIANGNVEKADNYYVYIINANDPTIEKISKVINYKKEDNYFIIEEVAGFIYDNTISKYSDIDNSIIKEGTKEELEEYFQNNQKEFTTFKHKFVYNSTTNSYNYSETIIK